MIEDNKFLKYLLDLKEFFCVVCDRKVELKKISDPVLCKRCQEEFLK